MKKIEILKKNVNIASSNKSKEYNYFWNVFFMYVLFNTLIMCSVVSEFENPKSYT